MLPVLSAKKRLQLYLDLEWIFERLSHEMSFKQYETNEHPVRAFSLNYILKHIKSNHTVIDLGCDKGEMSFVIANKAKHIIGIDYDKNSIEQALKSMRTYKKDNLEFIVAEASEYFKKNNQNFDVLILSHILEHLDDPEVFLKWICPRFKYVYIEVPDFDKTYSQHYRKMLNSKLIYTDNDHVSEFDRDEIIKIITACKLQIQDSEYRYGVQKYWCTTA